MALSKIHSASMGIASTSAPSNPIKGQIWYDSTNNFLKQYNGSVWVSVDVQAPKYSIEYLVIAGGGGGNQSAYDDGSGGGAGGYRSNVPGQPSGRHSPPEPMFMASSKTTYTIVVGAGGANYGSNGNNSSFGDIVAYRGAGGGSHRGAGREGGSGSGSGGRYDGGDNTTGGAGYYGQGYDGGTKTDYPGGGGGGGAGGSGGGGSGNGKAGGSGMASTITGSSVTRAGGGGAYSGGGAGSGGGGGGGNGGSSTAGSGTANTGSGGGGNGQNAISGAGGSGVVIIRMLTSNYSGTYTGSPSISTTGDYTVLTFNSSGSYTA